MRRNIGKGTCDLCGFYSSPAVSPPSILRPCWSGDARSKHCSWSAAPARSAGRADEAALAEARVPLALKDIADATGYRSGRPPPSAMAEGLRKHLRLLSAVLGEVAHARARSFLGTRPADCASWRAAAGYRASAGRLARYLRQGNPAVRSSCRCVHWRWRPPPEGMDRAAGCSGGARQPPARVSGMRRERVADFERRLANACRKRRL